MGLCVSIVHLLAFVGTMVMRETILLCKVFGCVVLHGNAVCNLSQPCCKPFILNLLTWWRQSAVHNQELIFQQE